MPIDASIYQAFAPRPKGALDYAQEFAGLDAARQAQQAGALQQQANQAKFDEYQRGVQKATALEQLMGSMAGKPEAEVLQGLRGAGRFQEAGAMESSMLDRQKKVADIRKDTASAGETEHKTSDAKRKTAIYDIAMMPDIESARASISRMVTGPEKLPMHFAQALLQSMPQDSAELPRWKHELFMKMATPEAQTVAATAAATREQTAARNAQIARNELIQPDGTVNQPLFDAKAALAKAAQRPRG